MWSDKLVDIRRKVKGKVLARVKDDPKYEVSDDKIRLAGDFFKAQTRISLKNYDIIDPESIEEYIAFGGYNALYKALFEMTPIEVIEEVKKSNLKGRGGAGFPTGRKWEGAFKINDYPKYIICNADEGDPGAFMDRSLLEGDPHSVIEGMMICAYGVGASKGYVYVRAEYPKAVKTLSHAIEAAKTMNLLGDNIMGSDFSFDLQIRLGAGAFVCGESTALIQSIEGRRGLSQQKVYRTTHKGLFDKPTVLNNVETLSNVPQIIEKGADWYLSYGTEDSSGTKVFCLVGKVANSGLVEVPMGTTLREIIYGIGGGAAGGKKVKAVQTGGPSGGCIPEELFDTKVDFISLANIGSIMGSGGMVVMDEDDCMVDIAKFFMEFTVDESCGKCTPCRIGNKRVLEILQKISSGRGDLKDIEKLEELSAVITGTSLCGLGKTATTPVISSLQYFRDEYLAHLEGRCPAKVCKDLLKFTILDKCVGCGLCARNCPVGCISGGRQEMHVIDQDKCIKCGNCHKICPVHAIDLT